MLVPIDSVQQEPLVNSTGENKNWKALTVGMLTNSNSSIKRKYFQTAATFTYTGSSQ